jgi:hypothetical protein
MSLLGCFQGTHQVFQATSLVPRSCTAHGEGARRLIDDLLCEVKIEADELTVVIA